MSRARLLLVLLLAIFSPVSCVRYIGDGALDTGSGLTDGSPSPDDASADSGALDASSDSAMPRDASPSTDSDGAGVDIAPDLGRDAPRPIDVLPIAGEATWVAGSNEILASNTTDTPGSRRFCATFGGNALWIYGGSGLDASGTQVNLADLWRYDAIGGWIHVSGPLTGSLGGDWGTRGVEAASNNPGSRNSALFGADSQGNLWLYGGGGTDSAGTSGHLADLWRYSPSTGQWTWVAGRNIAGLAPIFGARARPDATSLPGQRIDGALWVDTTNKVWLFAGKEPGNFTWRNDLWSYDPNGDVWTWHGGYNDAASYGVEGVEAATNWPGRRFDFGTARAPDGNVYIFGGEGRGETGEWVLGDLWRFRPSTTQWTFLAGFKTTGNEGVYVSPGVPDPTARPGARTSTRLVADGSGALWLFGGFGKIVGVDNSLNDLWRYDLSSGLWTWVGGADVGDQPGVYDGATPWPGARDAHGLAFASGYVLLFGGAGRDVKDARGLLNDVWRLGP